MLFQPVSHFSYQIFVFITVFHLKFLFLFQDPLHIFWNLSCLPHRTAPLLPIVLQLLLQFLLSVLLSLLNQSLLPLFIHLPPHQFSQSAQSVILKDLPSLAWQNYPNQGRFPRLLSYLHPLDQRQSRHWCVSRQMEATWKLGLSSPNQFRQRLTQTTIPKGLFTTQHPQVTSRPMFSKCICKTLSSLKFGDGKRKRQLMGKNRRHSFFSTVIKVGCVSPSGKSVRKVISMLLSSRRIHHTWPNRWTLQ